MLCPFYENHLKLYNELKCHILYNNAKITNKIKDIKKARKNIRAFVSMFGIAVTKILNGFCIVQRYSKIRQMQKKTRKILRNQHADTRSHVSPPSRVRP